MLKTAKNNPIAIAELLISAFNFLSQYSNTQHVRCRLSFIILPSRFIQLPRQFRFFYSKALMINSTKQSLLSRRR
uniref:Uncharacterized protein n=1 Tax=Candidatus Kentrum sp. LPFa TaxID=2126335 RepID=A0A450WZC6_9GAMM|nr:MAG: hypothetical protein BECKLPF1236B_GA0070989_13062 [Candidatus Kentron sp. LPFa]